MPPLGWRKSKDGKQAKAQRHAAFLDEETDSASAAMVRAREWRHTTLAALHRHDGAEGAQEGADPPAAAAPAKQARS